MSPLIILGAGPHAYEMADIVRQINDERESVNGRETVRAAPAWDLLGFLVPEAQAGRVGERSACGDVILGTYAELMRYPEARLVPEVNCGCPDLPRERLASLIAPGTFVAGTARIGSGSVIYPNCFVGHNAVLGERCFVLGGSVLNHDDRLEEEVVVCSGVTLAGFVHVGPGCYLGQACTIKQYVRVGRGSLIGMGAVVLRDVLPNSVMVGNPARRLGDRAA
jgi:acyl-[acyl carrier protein]--UDP-N-acetylglucosamine O-acyltransferase